MIFTFNKKKVSDFIKVVQYMEKENIDFEVVGDLSVSVGKAEEIQTSRPQTSQRREIPQEDVVDPDPLWKPTDCTCCDSRDKMACKHRCHYGALEL